MHDLSTPPPLPRLPANACRGVVVPGEQNIHIGPRKIWLTRHAESVCSDYEPGEEMDELTEEGRRYSMTVAKYLHLEQV